MAEQHDAPLGAPVAKDKRELRLAVAALAGLAAGENDAETGPAVLGVPDQEGVRRYRES
jgi:hypothetical protein